MTRNLACGAAGLLLAALYYTLADDLPRSLLDDPTGSSGLPKLLALLLGGFSLALVAVSFVRRPADGEVRSAAAHLRAAGMLALGIGYVVLLPWLGYFGSILLLIIGVAFYAGARRGPAPVVVGVAGAVVLWGLFVRLFGIPMPGGVWFG